MSKNLRAILIFVCAIVGALVGFFAVTYQGKDGGAATFWGAILGGWVGYYLLEWANASED